MSADIFSAEKRSEVMSAVRSRGNRSTEVRLLEILRARKISGWRRRHPLFGSPDLVFPVARVAIFTDGCFWHGCPKHGTLPASNREFWKAKIDRNRSRDREVSRELRRRGWRVVRFWEHELRKGSEALLVAKLRRAGLPAAR